MARFARQIAGQGYIVAAPSSYHEFTGPEPLQYNAEDTDKGNAWKIGKVSTSDHLGHWGLIPRHTMDLPTVVCMNGLIMPCHAHDYVREGDPESYIL